MVENFFSGPDNKALRAEAQRKLMEAKIQLILLLSEKMRKINLLDYALKVDERKVGSVEQAELEEIDGWIAELEGVDLEDEKDCRWAAEIMMGIERKMANLKNTKDS